MIRHFATKKDALWRKVVERNYGSKRMVYGVRSVGLGVVMVYAYGSILKWVGSIF